MVRSELSAFILGQANISFIIPGPEDFSRTNTKLEIREKTDIPIFVEVCKLILKERPPECSFGNIVNKVSIFKMQ